MTGLRSERITVTDSQEAVDQLFLARGWGDGLPIVPPTVERVERMLSAAGRDPQEVLAELPPRWGEATVEKVAINAVMAGCLPEYMPVLIAAVEAMADPRFNLYAIQATTHPVAPLLILNGPIRRELEVNCGAGAFGPGWRANATIGRAIRLILMNIGGGTPGRLDKAAQGQPSKYTYCIGENEEESPWEPLHTERGFPREASTVTVVAGENPHNINDHSSTTAQELLTIVAETMAVPGCNNAYTGGEVVVAFGPEHAATIAADGLSKRDVKEFLHKKALVPLERFTPQALRDRFPEGELKGPIPVARSPEDIILLVVGGAGKHSCWIPTFGGTTRSVTREIGQRG